MTEKYRSALGLMPTTTKYKYLIAQKSNFMNIFTYASLIHSYQTWREKVASTRQRINHLLRNVFILGYLDMIWNGYQLLELNEHSEMHEFLVHSPLFEILCNHATRRWQFTVVFECKINVSLYSSWQVLTKNCTSRWTFLTKHTCAR